MDLNPMVEQLADCETDAARADWLLQTPDGVIARDHMSIRLLLREAGFLRGVECLDIRFASLNATRLKTGDLPLTVKFSLEMALSVLREVARGPAPVRKDHQ